MKAGINFIPASVEQAMVRDRLLKSYDGFYYIAIEFSVSPVVSRWKVFILLDNIFTLHQNVFSKEPSGGSCKTVNGNIAIILNSACACTCCIIGQSCSYYIISYTNEKIFGSTKPVNGISCILVYFPAIFFF